VRVCVRAHSLCSVYKSHLAESIPQVAISSLPSMFLLIPRFPRPRAKYKEVVLKTPYDGVECSEVSYPNIMLFQYLNENTRVSELFLI
jgi:hypothetical protein